MYPFIFWGSYYNEIDSSVEKMSGCTFADTYAEAMSNIEEYYGDDLNDIHLEPLEENNVLVFANPQEGKNIVKNY